MLQQKLRLIPEKEPPLCCLNEKKEKGKRGEYNHLNFKDSNLSKLPSLLLERNGKKRLISSEVKSRRSVAVTILSITLTKTAGGAGRGALQQQSSPSLRINVLPHAGE